MRISWNNGYWSSPRLQDIEVTEAPCRRHVVFGDNAPRKVAVIDASDGEYEPVLLCHECLVDLANELLGEHCARGVHSGSRDTVASTVPSRFSRRAAAGYVAMKPRPKPCRLTIEDENAWVQALRRTAMPSFVWDGYEKADRRDAELMLRIAHAVQLGSSAVDQHQAFFPCHWCHRWYPGWYTFSGFRCECRDVNITNFA